MEKASLFDDEDDLLLLINLSQRKKLAGMLLVSMKSFFNIQDHIRIFMLLINNIREKSQT